MPTNLLFLIAMSPILLSLAAGCAQTRPVPAATTDPSAAPPPKIKAWMDRLTVAHEYDPKTGFIVAREVVALPPLIADAPPLDAAGNSVQGQLAAKYLSQALGLDLFASQPQA